jgi:branched-chain amino acid transport system ATP-binding protein
MLEVSGLDVNIGPVPILRQVTLSVPAGATVGLIGRNGAGKTTLLRSVMGLLRSQAGRIGFGEQELTGAASHRRAHLGIGYMPEDRRLVPDMTAEENILLPAWSTGAPDVAERLDWIYGLMPEIREFRDRGATQLSGGQQKMVALGRALIAGTRLLLLDEPTEGIAPVLAHRMSQVLADLKAAGQSVLVAESNDKHIADVINRTYVIERGSVVELQR